jgi:hypothetical protein
MQRAAEHSNILPLGLFAEPQGYREPVLRAGQHLVFYLPPGSACENIDIAFIYCDLIWPYSDKRIALNAQCRNGVNLWSVRIKVGSYSSPTLKVLELQELA